MREKIVAGNWKMNNNLSQAKALIKGIGKTIATKPLKNTKIMVAPAFVHLDWAVKSVEKMPMKVMAQNMHYAENGAFTGEVSPIMLKDIGVDTVILGHSERRAYFNETNVILAKKVTTALSHKFTIIFCLGEQLEDRKSNRHFEVVENQLAQVLFPLKEECWENIIIAYEPVWAIGTGRTASPEQAQEMHAFIRNLIATKYYKKIADTVAILYGGSIKPTNAKAIFSKPDVDGGLIGGASLNVADFIAIISEV